MRRILIVVGLITILGSVGYLFSFWSDLKVQARTKRLNEDIENLFTALHKYKEYCGAYPTGSNPEVAKALQGKNPKNVIILVGRKNELNDKGEFVDSWGTPLRLYFADNTVLIRSAGPNRRFDDTTSLECDDLFRSN